MKCWNWLRPLLLICGMAMFNPAPAAEVRFDSHYFYQTEEQLVAKGVNFKDLARYSRQIQTKVWNVFKKAKMQPATGYLVVAVRSDGDASTWLDMDPALHEFYLQQIEQEVINLNPIDVKTGIVVFAIKMSINTPKFTKKETPDPDEFKAARAKLPNGDNIEALVLSIWPE